MQGALQEWLDQSWVEVTQEPTSENGIVVLLICVLEDRLLQQRWPTSARADWSTGRGCQWHVSGFLDYLLQKWLRGKQSCPHCKLPLFVQLLLFLGVASCSVRSRVVTCRRSGLGNWFAIEIEYKNEASAEEVKAKCQDDSE